MDNHTAFRQEIYTPDELELILDYSTKAEALSEYMQQNEQTLRHSLTNTDWLHIYGQAIGTYGLDMKQVLRMTTNNDKGSMEEHLADLQGDLKGIFNSPHATYEDLAAYARFLSELSDIGSAVEKQQNAGDYEQFTDYFVRQMDIVDGEELLRSQSLYEMIKHTKHRLTNTRGELRQDLASFANLQERLFKEKRTRENIGQLASKRCSETQKVVEQALASTSGYVNLGEV